MPLTVIAAPWKGDGATPCGSIWGSDMGMQYFSLAAGDFVQDWSDTGQITANDDWSGVPSITGYRGDGLASGTGVNPQNVKGSSTVVDVVANQTNPNTNSSGGVAEFQIANPTIALQGSGTADAPYIVLHLDAGGREDVTISYNLRDIDGSADNAAQQVALQYRTSETGEWIDVPAGYVADATTGPSLAEQVTAVTATLPADANNAATLQVRIITTNAGGNDEWVGVDDIRVSSTELTEATPGTLSIADALVAEGDSGTTEMTFTVSREGGSSGAVAASYTIGLDGEAAASDFPGSQPLSGTVEFADGETSRTITVQIAGDTEFEPNETFSVTLSGPTGGASLGDASATGTIANDDASTAAGVPFINEIHYDDAGGDTGEGVEIAGPAGTDLSGWSLVFYNGNGGTTYGTVALAGTIPDQDDGYGTLSFAAPAGGIQNGSPDAIALVDAGGQVVQFLSYEGTLTATNGPATGLTSTDIGVAENPAPADGFSLQLVGAGADYSDFRWQNAADDSFGSVNTGQNFIGADQNGLVTIGDASVVEGDSGVQQLVFTVRKAGGTAGTGSVDYTINLNDTADQEDLAPGTPLTGTVTFAAGETVKQIVVGIAGDTAGEFNERLNVSLWNPSGAVAITDANAIGTIVNDDPLDATISVIQGEGHTSQLDGQRVTTQGIVTAIDSNGFYLQDATGDGNARTSDAVFVLTGSAPAVALGDQLQVVGTVSEFLPGGDADNLTVTQIVDATLTTVSTGNALPAAVLIGAGGVLPPSAIIEDDAFTSFDPETDGLDFFESLEGMRVTIDNPLVVDETNEFGETDVVASGGMGATGVGPRGGIAVSEGDFNPEKIQIDDDSGLFAGFDPNYSQGDRLSSVTGVVSYGFEEYEVLVTEAVTQTADVSITPETTSLDGDRDTLSVATYNLLNIDPGDDAQKFDILAKNIVFNLSAPDIIAVQEIQDGNGAGGTDPLSGQPTADLLIAAIAANGGPDYVYVEIAPTSSGSTGGEGGGNIRSGFFYNPDRVSLVEGGLTAITATAFNGTRQPLVGTFAFNGEEVSVINVHLTARLGSQPLTGATQPPANGGEGAREAQTAAVRDYVEAVISEESDANIIVAGDFNAFYFEEALTQLETGGVLTNLLRTLPEEDRYSYQFGGNLQALDNMLVTGGLAGGARFDAVHINSEVPFGTPRGSDHDPLLATFFIEAPNEAPVANADSYAVGKNKTLEIDNPGVLANDTDIDEDALSAALVSGPRNGTLSLAADGSFIYTPNAGYVGTDSFTYRATDAEGASSTATVSITVEKTPTFFGDGQMAQRTAEDGNQDLRAIYKDRDGTVIDAGAGNDTLRGGNADDIMIGGAGDDQMFAGRGADEFRFFGTDIEGASDTDRLYDLTFGSGDVLTFEGFGAGTFSDGAYIDANEDGSGALISSYLGLVGAARSGDVTAFRQSPYNDNLVVRVTNEAGQVQELFITAGWSQFTAAGGESMM